MVGDALQTPGEKRRWRRFQQLPREERGYWLAVAALSLFGALLRIRGQYWDASGFWYDEALWAISLMTQSLRELSIRPIGFMWLSRLLADGLGPTEFWLRLLPNLAALLSLAVIPYLASQLLRTRLARLLLIFAFALHPALIDFAKEFKPYSCEVLLHLLPLLLYFRFRQTQKLAYYYALLGSLPLLFLFAYNITFAYPATLLVALFAGFRAFGRRGALLAVGSGALCLALVVGIYFSLLRDVGGGEAPSYWGAKYGVFYTPYRSHNDASAPGARQTRLGWLARTYVDVAALPGARRELWQPPAALPGKLTSALGRLDTLLWLGLHLTGLVYLAVRRRYAELGLLATPLLCAVIANRAGLWPLGAFRTNLFLCAYSLPIAAVGADVLCEHPRRRLAVALAVLALSIVPGFAFGFDFHRTKQMWTRQDSHRMLLATLRSIREQRLQRKSKLEPERLWLDLGDQSVHDYYLEINPHTRAEYRAFFAAHFKRLKGSSLESAMVQQLEASKKPFWVLTLNLRPKDPLKVRALAKVLREEAIGETHRLFWVQRKPAP